MKELAHQIAVAIDELGSDHNMRRDRPYLGQTHTSTGIRGMTEVRGITFRDLRDCYVRAVLLSAYHLVPALYDEAAKGPDAVLCENDLYGFNLDELDPIAIVQNLCCEVEKVMGIFPNVPELKTANVEFSGGAPLHGAASAGTQGYASGGGKDDA